MASDEGDGESAAFAPHPLFPHDPEFYRRVLEEVPSPIAVIDDQGRIIYGNRSARRWSGWSVEESVGRNLIDEIYPEDLAWAVEVFARATANEHLGEDEPEWGTIVIRGVAGDGTVTPLEVTGANGLHDAHVGGLIYDLRPAWARHLLHDAVTGLARGDAADELLGLVTSLVGRPPLGIEAALVERLGRDDARVVASTHPALVALTELDDPSWMSPSGDEPAHVRVGALQSPAGSTLAGAGFDDLWDLAVDGAGRDVDRSLVAVTRPGVIYPDTIAHRLVEGRDLARIVLARARYDAELAHAARHDGLTGLANRRAVYDRLDAVTPHDGAVGVVIVDLDEFKPVNDRWGHQAGDEVLRVVAQRLVAVMRPDDLVGRLGGDEFAIVVAPPVDGAALTDVVRRIGERVAEPISLETTSEPVVVRASVGAALASSGVPVDRLLSAADGAMYEAKRADTVPAVRVVGAA